MPEVSKNIGFATAAQRTALAGAGQNTAPQLTPGLDEQEKLIVEKVNEGIEKFDEYMKEYIANYVENAVPPIIRDYMGGMGFKDRKITDTPTDDYAIPNRKFVAAGSQPSNPVKGQSYNDGSKQQFWTGSAWVTWPNP